MDVADHIGFLKAIVPSRSKRTPRRSKPRRSKPRQVVAAEKKAPRERRSWLPFLRRLVSKEAWQAWLSDVTVRWVIASAIVVVVAALAVFAANSFGMILVLLGMVALIIAALAASDDLSAYGWIPGNLSETTLVIAGAIAMVTGGALIVIS